MNLTKKLSGILNSNIFTFFLFLIIALCLYWPSLAGEFWGDDASRIRHAFKFFDQSFFESIRVILPDRPLLTASNYIVYHLFGEAVFFHRLVNILLHGIISFFVYLLIKILFKKNKTALLGGILFLIHTLHTQTIYIVIQRGVLLSALSILVSFYLFILYEKNKLKKNLIFSYIAFLMGILAKPNIIVFPLFLLMYLVFKKINLKNYIIRLIPFFVISTIPAITYLLLPYNRQISPDRLSNWDYLVVQSQVVFEYVKLIFYPEKLMMYKKFVYNLPLLKGWNWIYAIFHLVMIAYAVKNFRKTSAFFILGMYLFFAPESSIFPINHIYFEHRTYIPIIFFTISLAGLLSFRNKWILGIFVIWVGVLTTKTFQRNMNFGNSDFNQIYAQTKIKPQFPFTYLISNIHNDFDLTRSRAKELMKEGNQYKSVELMAQSLLIEFFNSYEQENILNKMQTALKDNQFKQEVQYLSYNWYVSWFVFLKRYCDLVIHDKENAYSFQKAFEAFESQDLFFRKYFKLIPGSSHFKNYIYSNYYRQLKKGPLNSLQTTHLNYLESIIKARKFKGL